MTMLTASPPAFSTDGLCTSSYTSNGMKTDVAMTDRCHPPMLAPEEPARLDQLEHAVGERGRAEDGDLVASQPSELVDRVPEERPVGVEVERSDRVVGDLREVGAGVGQQVETCGDEQQPAHAALERDQEQKPAAALEARRSWRSAPRPPQPGECHQCEGARTRYGTASELACASPADRRAGALAGCPREVDQREGVAVVEAAGLRGVCQERHAGR